MGRERLAQPDAPVNHPTRHPAITLAKWKLISYY